MEEFGQITSCHVTLSLNVNTRKPVHRLKILGVKGVNTFYFIMGFLETLLIYPFI